MKTLIIGKEGRELGRYQLSKDNLLIGRSPLCDLVIRAAHIQPMHYWLEYVSTRDDETTDTEGFWMLTNISQSRNNQDKSELIGNFTGEGVVLSSDRLEFKGLDFELIDDHLQESDIKRGALRRDFERNLEKSKMADTEQKRNSILSIAYYRRDLDFVSNIFYLTRTNSKKQNRIFPTVKDAYLCWNHDKAHSPAAGHLYFTNKTNFTEVEVFDRDKKLQPVMKNNFYIFDVNPGSFLVIKTPLMDYLLRFVPFFEAQVSSRSAFADPAVMATLLVILTVFVVNWATHNMDLKIEEPDVPKRVATVFIKEEPPPAAPPPPQEPPPPIEEAPPPPPPEPIIEKKPPALKDPGASMANAAQTVNTTINKPKAGLDNPAPVKNINTLGLLGKLKGKKSENTLAADSILNQGVIAEKATGETGFVVKQSAAGVLGASTKIKDNALAEASTTLSNASASDPAASGPLAITGGKGKFSYGSGNSGDLGSGSRSDGLGGGESLEVVGGLDKNAVREAIARERRALRNCYESALLTKSQLAGKLVLRFQITAVGNVVSTRIENTTLNTPQFESCIEGVIKAIMFPKAPNGQPTTVIYPFVFQGKK
jgi:outer membrane biosynthesis protein TonB